ncbi:MAG: hypothetical protein H6607_01420 [Flavobacteriales bacterium]|nr:hypothetical protein [Flavobacteriales bacterium]
MKVEKSILFFVLLTLVNTSCLTLCGGDGDDVIMEGGCMGQYVLANQSGADLFVKNHFGTLVEVLRGDTVVYDSIWGFNSMGEPWIDQPYLELYQSKNDSLLPVYEAYFDKDTIWITELIDGQTYCARYTFPVNDSMLK